MVASFHSGAFRSCCRVHPIVAGCIFQCTLRRGRPLVPTDERPPLPIDGDQCGETGEGPSRAQAAWGDACRGRAAALAPRRLSPRQAPPPSLPLVPGGCTLCPLPHGGSVADHLANSCQELLPYATDHTASPSPPRKTAGIPRPRLLVTRCVDRGKRQECQEGCGAWRPSRADYDDAPSLARTHPSSWWRNLIGVAVTVSNKTSNTGIGHPSASLICLAEFERKTETGALHPLRNRLTLALRSALGVTP